jgi:hypothetical protein
MLTSLKLPIAFAPDRLVTALDAIRSDDWVPHFNSSYYEGLWSGVALRSVGGVAKQLYPDPTATTFGDTPILTRCPYFQEVLASFQCPLESVRLLKLTAGSSIREHRDYKLGYEDGVLRLHIPVITSPDVAFFLEDQQIVMNPGECWYLNLNLRHRVENHSTIDRVHLVIDCIVNDWLHTFFALDPSP